VTSSEAPPDFAKLHSIRFFCHHNINVFFKATSSQSEFVTPRSLPVPVFTRAANSLTILEWLRERISTSEPYGKWEMQEGWFPISVRLRMNIPWFHCKFSYKSSWRFLFYSKTNPQIHSFQTVSSLWIFPSTKPQVENWGCGIPHVQNFPIPSWALCLLRKWVALEHSLTMLCSCI
jgi:hypothetical protein